jgi:antitoxin HicB
MVYFRCSFYPMIGKGGGAVQNYSFSVLWSESDGEYVATSAEFPGLSGLGPTAEEALSELRSAMEIAIAAFVEDGETIPEPQHLQEYSGQFRFRVPKSLHAALASRATLEGVSLNALVQMYVSSGLALDKLATLATQRLDVSIARVESACSLALQLRSEDSGNVFDTQDAAAPDLLRNQAFGSASFILQ